MSRYLLAMAILVWAGSLMAAERACGLPKPHYRPKPGDPAWLAAAVQFHGHLGPWAVSGIRLGAAGLRKVGAEGYFDVEVTCEGPLAKPPKACFLDGLQVGTGATLGKRNLHWVEAQQVVVRVKNLRTGQTAEVRPTAKLMELLASFQPQPRVGGAKAADDHGPDATKPHKEEPAGALARQVAAMSDEDLLTVALCAK